MSSTASHTRHTVTAIIVAHDGAKMLSGLVRALATQTHQVERVVGVDTGSVDGSGNLLGELIGRERMFAMPRDTGFGEAVATALRHREATRTLRTGPDTRRVEWVWLLHDDCEPVKDALEKLLRAATKDRTVVVLGPKVLDGTDRRTLRETGFAVDRAGRRVTGIDPGEIDQGQHDGNRGVLAVSSAGMLVRRDVWDQLGGFDQHLKFFRDDLDFCWRVQGAGYRVQVVTDAVLYHRELSARRRRGDTTEFRRLIRRNTLYVFAVNLPLPQMFLILAGCIAGSLVRIAWFLLTKQKDHAAAHAYAIAWLFLNPYRICRGRSARAAGRKAGYAAVRSLIPRGRTLSKLAENIAGLLSAGPPRATGGRHHAVIAEEDEEEQFVDHQSLTRRVITHPCVQLVVVLLVVALVAERRLLGTSPLGGGALVPAWGGTSALWSEYFAGFHAVGLGSAASAPPYLAVVAALGTLFGGQAWLAVDVLLLGCVPLAGLTAYLASRRLATASAARVLLAASYAILPVAMGAIAAGRLGTAVTFALLPLIGINAGRMLTAPPKPARRAAWATGLLAAVAAAFTPLAWLIAVALAAVAVVVRRWQWPVSRVDAAIVAGTPFFVLFPWSLHLLASPSAFLAETGVRTGSVAASPPGLLMLSPGGPGLPPLWVTAGLGLALIAAFLPHRRRILTGTGWSVAAVGYLAAIVVSRDSAGDWPGVALAVTAAGLLLAAAPAAQWLTELGLAQQGPADTRRRVISWTVLVFAATAPVLAAGFWMAVGVQGPVGPVTQQVMPAFVTASSAGGTQYRTLVLRPTGDSLSAPVEFTVARGGDPSLGQPELTGYGAAEQALSRQVAALAAPDGADSGDPGQQLGAFGIHWVLLPAPVDQSLATRLNASAGLVPLSASSAYDLWQVVSPGPRLRVLGSDGTVTPIASQQIGASDASVPAPGGELVLAEPYGGWTALLNGVAIRPLPSPVNGWEQGFTLPSGGGTLTLVRSNLARGISLWAELLVLLVIVVLALPGKREDPAAEAEAIAAVRAAQHSGRLARARKTRELTWAAATKIAESPTVQRALPGIVSGVTTSPVTGVVGRGAVHVSRTMRLLRKLSRKNPARRTAGAPAALTAGPPLALPAAPSSTALSSTAPSSTEPPTRIGPPVSAEPPIRVDLPVTTGPIAVRTFEPAKAAFEPPAEPASRPVSDPLTERPAEPAAERPESPRSSDEILAQIMADVTGDPRDSGSSRSSLSSGSGPLRVPAARDLDPAPSADEPDAAPAAPATSDTSPGFTLAGTGSAPPWDPAPSAPPVASSPPWEPLTEPPASTVSTWPTPGPDTGPFAAQSPIPRAALERSDPMPVLRERPELRERPDPAAGRLERPERGSHRGGRHGKPPGRRRRKDQGGDA